MKTVVQLTSFSGKMIEGGKWEVDIQAGLQLEQTISLNLPIKDPALIKYLGKQQSSGCVVDKEEDNTYTVAVACKVMRIRHMIHTLTNKAESMAVIMPEDRTCEHVLMYLLAPNKCDQRFIALVRGIPIQPPSP